MQRFNDDATEKHSVGSSVPTITGLRARSVRAPLKRPIVTANTSIPDSPLLLLDVETDGGVTGHAYVFGYAPTTLKPMVSLVKEIAPSLVGKPVAPVILARSFAAQFRLLGRQGLLGMVLSGLDMALWDALGKHHQSPVAALLGGDCSPIAAYDSHGVVDPIRDASDLEQSMKSGFKAIKIKIGAGSIRDDICTIKGVKQIIGDETRLLVDYNQSLTTPDAIHRVNALAFLDIYWVEEPVQAEDLAGHAKVRQATGVPIQTGENWWFPEDIARSVAAGASDFAMLDIMKIGGITGWINAVGQAHGASLPVSSHLFVEASAHALAVTPTAQYLEFLDVAHAVLAVPNVVENGSYRPHGPGLGIEWNEKAVARYLV